MMTVERVTVQQVQEELKEFFEEMLDQGFDVVEFDINKVTQALVNEMNGEIVGFDPSIGSASSYVPQTVWQVMADDDLVDEELEDEFITWYEAKHA